MAREITFVLTVDLDNQTVRIDDDTYVARFGRDEQVWDTELTKWRDYEDGELTLAVEILNTKKLEED
jgi:hypothetical protein